MSSSSTWRALGALAAVAAVALAAESAAQKSPAPSATASASVSPSASASSAKLEIPPLEPPLPPPLDAEPLPSEKSKPPKPDEWKDAVPVRLSRGVPACTARRLREWLRIHCDEHMGGGRLIAGNLEGVSIWPFEAAPPDQPWNTTGTLEIILPVRVGDRRVFELFGLDSGYEGGFFPTSEMLLEEYWIEGQKPVVALRLRR